MIGGYMALINRRRGGLGGRLVGLGELFKFNRPTAAAAESSSSSSALVCSSANLFVGGLCYDTNETALKDAFSPFGDVIAVKVICHPTTGMSKGFGFVKFSSEDQAAAALQKMNGQAIDGRSIRVHYANNRT